MRFPRALLLLAAPALLLTACANPEADPATSGEGPGATGAVQPPAAAIPAEGEVVGQGMVFQREGEDAIFCVGPILESYPPQCDGPVIVGWEWPDDRMYDTDGLATFGTYAIVGEWDGVEFTPTQPAIPLALYDPIRPEPDPRSDPANAGATAESVLLRVQEELHAWTDVRVLDSVVDNGYVWANVYHDDGTIQAHLDEIYGADVVIVTSAFAPIPTLG